MRTLTAAFTFLLAPLLPLPAEEKPNVVFLIADDLGWADVAFHGGNIPTPHLDALREEGVELTQHYVAPVCSPTRAGLMTGRLWSRFNVTTPQNDRALPWDTLTLPKALKSAGYETALVGKWHLGSKPEEGPQKFGFDHGYGSLAGGVSPYGHFYKKGPFSKTWHRNAVLLEEEGHVTDLLADEAVRWIEGRGDRPFFLYLPFTAVHLPVKEPEEWLAKVPGDIVGEVPRHYAACVMHLDGAVGRIIDAVERKGVRASTLIVFTSDNGGSTVENNDPKYPDDQCPSGKLPGDNRPLRDQKGSVYEGGIRVPTLVSWPGRLPAGKYEGLAQIVDWMPTFCGLAGVKSGGDPKWDGIDLWPMLSGREGIKPRPIYTAGPRFRKRALREGDWKLVVSEQEERIELFDLSADPGEATDRSASRPDKVAELRARLGEIAAADGDAVVE